MIYKSKKIVLEFFDKNLHGTVTGTYKFKKFVELDTTKRTKIATQLRQFALKDEALSRHINMKGNSAVMVKLVMKDNSVTALIDLRK